jgi:hypothetical protein
MRTRRRQVGGGIKLSSHTVHMEYDPLLVSSYLLKQDDLGVPTIECTINQRIFHKTFYDTESGVNIMVKVTYEYFGKEPLYPTSCEGQVPNIKVNFTN